MHADVAIMKPKCKRMIWEIIAKKGCKVTTILSNKKNTFFKYPFVGVKAIQKLKKTIHYVVMVVSILYNIG